MRDRGRIPFALIGVLVLVTSGTLVATERDTVPREPAVDRALDGLAAESATAIRAGVREAGRDTARRPVLDPANSTLGDQLDPDRPFVDALRLRIYRRVAANLRRLDGQRQGLDVRARLPRIDSPAAAGDAIDRVRIERLGDQASRVRVTIDGIELRATRGDRTVATASRTPTLVVRSPILAVHDRVTTFQQALDAELERHGLARGLTASLYPVAWARGYAQFHGQPIENVVANRHLELLTNGAALGLQRDTFGRADPLGRLVYAKSVLETALTDLLAATDGRAAERLQRLRSGGDPEGVSGGSLPRPTPDAAAPERDDRIRVDLGRTADLVFRQAVARLDRTVNRTYRPRVRARATVRRLNRVHRSEPRPANATGRVDTRMLTRYRVARGSGDVPTAATGWHELHNYTRTVTVERRRLAKWALGPNETTTTVDVERETHAVGLLVAGNHSVGPAPDRPIARVHRHGGPYGGRNLADVRGLAGDLVDRQGGADALARRAVAGTLESDHGRVAADRPDGLTGAARTRLARLHRRVRNLSVSVSRGRIGTFEANVAARLAAKLRDRRESLVSAPSTYPDVAGRALVGVRADYLDRVLARLDRAGAAHERGRGRLADHLPDTGVDPAALLSKGRTATRVGGRANATVPMHVDATPSYLTLEAVAADRDPGLSAGRPGHPLVARNVNAFAVPTSGMVKRLFDVLSGPEKTSFRSAARVVRTANRTAGDLPAAAALRNDLRNLLRWYRLVTVHELARRGLGDGPGGVEVVETALSRWSGPGARVAAVSNGSAGEAVVEAARERWPDALSDPTDRELLAIDLQTIATDLVGEERRQPPAVAVNRTAEAVRDSLDIGERLRDRATSAARERAAALASRLPSGIPVLPTPGLWYAMVNVWQVQVRGSYATFTVRVPRGAPDRQPADFRYLRENRSVRLDVDGDGSAERLGHNRRIEFRTETVVGVAVPPQPSGVGDVDERDERSPGWPEPGPVDK